MSLPAPPAPPAPASVEDRVRALFEEARRRRRLRRGIAGAAALVLALSAITVALVLDRDPGGKATTGHHHGTATQAPATPSRAGTPRVAWFDYAGFLHVGSPRAGTQRTVPYRAPAGTEEATALAARVGDDAYWATAPSGGPGATAAPRTIVRFDAATGRTSVIGHGVAVFPSADGKLLYVQPDPAHIEEMSATGRTIGPVHALPAGYVLSAYPLQWAEVAVAGGVLLQSAEPTNSPVSPDLLVWNPSTGSRHVVGRDRYLIGTYTDPADGESLVAWVPACGTGNGCDLALTNLSTGSTARIASPLGYGFDAGGAFSPDGRELAVFPSANGGASTPAVRLGLVDIATDTLRLVRGGTITVGEPEAWAAWSPSGEWLVAGSTHDHLLLRRGATVATPFSLLRDRATDVNYSAAVL